MFKARILRDGSGAEFDPPSLEACRPGEGEPWNGNEDLSPEARLEAIARDALRAGFEAGKRAGTEDAEREATVLLSGMREMLRAIGEERERALRELEPQVFELAVAIARRIVIEELAMRPELTAGIVKEAIRRIEKTGPLMVRIHPDFYEAFARHKAELLELHSEILLEVDPSVPPTGPLVIGPAEEIVTDPDEQIRNIVEEIKDAIATN